MDVEQNMSLIFQYAQIWNWCFQFYCFAMCFSHAYHMLPYVGVNFGWEVYNFGPSFALHRYHQVSRLTQTNQLQKKDRMPSSVIKRGSKIFIQFDGPYDFPMFPYFFPSKPPCIMDFPDVFHYFPLLSHSFPHVFPDVFPGLSGGPGAAMSNEAAVMQSPLPAASPRPPNFLARVG